jgi:hypothetical protein
MFNRDISKLQLDGLKIPSVKGRFRHEFKYYINYFEYEILKRKLKLCLRSDKNSDKNGEYHIRSLYFDDIRNTAIYEKQAGILSRKKYRIRIYNLSDEIIKLEKKSRNGQFISKVSAKISKNQYYKIISKDIEFLKFSNIKLFQEFYYDIVSSQYSPVVIVDYVREAYIWSHNNVRITFDKNLSSGLNSLDIFDNVRTVKAIEEPQLIVEIKYDNFLPDFIRKIIQIDSSQKYAISKYVICRKYTKLNSWEDN